MKPECCCVSQRDCLDIIARRRSGTSAGRVLPADSARHLLALLRTPLGPFPACSPGHSGQAPGPSAPSSRSRRSRQRVAPPPQGGRPCIVAIRPTRPTPRCDPWPPAPPRSDAPVAAGRGATVGSPPIKPAMYHGCGVAARAPTNRFLFRVLPSRRGRAPLV